jgi:hypothetical protein
MFNSSCLYSTDMNNIAGSSSGHQENIRCFQIVRQVAQREGMPLNRFRAMILAFVVENVFLNRNTNRTPRTRTCRGFFARLRTSGGGLRMTLLFVLFVRRHRKTSNSEAFTVRQVLRTSYQIFALCRRQVRIASGGRYSLTHVCRAFP